MTGYEPIKPFLRWAGSKRQVLSSLSTYWTSKCERYLEPFLGSASLFFHLRPGCSILGDKNSELIITYEQVKDNLDGVLTELSALRKGKEEYYIIRSLDVDSLTLLQRAARFIYLNRYSFNGLYRTNSKGDFNVPYGGEKSGNIPDRQSLEVCSIALRNATLVTGDFEKVLDEARTGDFVYLDPPYSVKAFRVFNEYSSINFGIQDLQRLRQWLEKLTESKIEFLLSYAKCEEAEILMKDNTVTEITVRRNIAGFSDNRRKAAEWLISNHETLS